MNIFHTQPVFTMARPNKLVYVEGNIGTGKSTFVENLRQIISRNYPGLRFTVVQEPVDQWMAMKDSNGKNLQTFLQ